MKILVVLCCMIFSCTAVATQTIKIGYIEFPPAFYTNQDNQAEGYLIDLADKVLKEAGYPWSARSLPPKRMAQNLATGEIDLWLGLKTLPAFKDTTLVGESVLSTIGLRAYTLGRKPAIRHKKDLQGKSLIILRGYSYGSWVKFIKDPANHIIYIETDGHEQALHLLKTGRANYLLDYRRPINVALDEVVVPGLQFNHISSLDIHFVVSRKTPNAREVLKRLEKAYKKLFNAGQL